MARHSMRHACVTRSPRRRRRGRESLPTAPGAPRTSVATQVQNVVKILGLRFGTKYTAENIKTLRYGHLMIMTDQDHDGCDLGVPRCYGASTPSTRVIFERGGRGWFLFRC